MFQPWHSSKYKLAIFLASIFVFCTSNGYADDKMTLSLDEAILLAVRNNPNVQSSRLNYVSQKFNLCIQQWQFVPHYSFQAGAQYNRTGSTSQQLFGTHNYNVQPVVSLLTPYGTQLTFSGTNAATDHYNPGLSFQIMQPLIRGFGKPVVEAALENAKDSEVIARLNVEGVLRSTVSSVISAYLDVVMVERTINIDEQAVRRAEKSVEQTRLYIQAGHKAGNELVTVQANVASAKMQLINDKNNLRQARYALLTAIGMDPNTDVTFTTLNLQNLINKYRVPSLAETKRNVLDNDVQYQVDQITLHGPTERSLLIAEDNTRWQLNFAATATTGNGSGGGANSGVNSLINGINQSQSVSLTLQVPIDDQISKQSVANAKIALKQADLALMQEKWNKETSGINGWNLVQSAEQSLRFAQAAEKLQEKTYNVSYQKYLHGLIDSLELQSAQLSLIQSQQTMLASEISYIRALVNLDLLEGNTLKTWNIGVRL